MRSGRSPTDAVRVVAYDGGWPAAFRREADRVLEVFGDGSVWIHHIGSTSVPGLCAKPVIDILVEVTDLGVVDRVSAELGSQGYVAKGEYGIPGRRYFSRAARGSRLKVHLHAFLRGSPEVARHLRFRDRLRADSALVAEYCALKQRLAAEHRENPRAYQAGKARFIEGVEREAAARSGS